jgi:hypothetical protein
MDTVTIRFDETLRVRQEGGWTGRNYWPRQTIFSFMSAGKYFPYVTTPGWPEIHDGLIVTALLELPEDWKSLLGWVNCETGEIAGPNPTEFLMQAGFITAWLLLAIVMVLGGLQTASIIAFAGVLFSGYLLYALYSAFVDWWKAKVTREVLKHLAEELKHNMSMNPDAYGARYQQR